MESGARKPNQKKAMASSLLTVLADTFAVYNKTHLFHWNVTGPQFASLHELFEHQYTDLWKAVDEIAERIRALDMPVPPDYATAHRSAGLNGKTSPAAAPDMLRHLVAAQGHLRQSLQTAMGQADEQGDEASKDLLIERLREADKSIWMLRSSL